MIRSICKFEGCGRADWTRGYCSKHYYRLRKEGNLPRVRNRKRRSLERIFHDSYSINLETLCWEWTAYVHPKGYPYFGDGEKNDHVRANRFAYEMYLGPLPKGKKVLHECDNRRCVNPAHLWLGDSRLNMLDCIDKGRNSQHRRPTHRSLTDQMAWNARIMFARGEIPMQTLADIYSVDQQTMSNLLRGRTYQKATCITQFSTS